VQLPLGSVNPQFAAVVLVVVELLNRDLNGRAVSEVAKGITLRLTRVFVAHHADRGDLPSPAEDLSKLILLRIVGHIANED